MYRSALQKAGQVFEAVQDSGSEALVELGAADERSHLAIRDHNVAVGQCGGEGVDVLDVVVSPPVVGVSVDGGLERYGDIEAWHGVKGAPGLRGGAEDIVERRYSARSPPGGRKRQ